jgi:hypothetical protein
MYMFFYLETTMLVFIPAMILMISYEKTVDSTTKFLVPKHSF